MSGKKYFRDGGGVTPPGIWAIVAKIADSTITIGQQEKLSRRPFIASVEGMINSGKEVPQTLIDTMNEYKAELKAEQKGGRIEARG